jgi:hypothetical protein
MIGHLALGDVVLVELSPRHGECQASARWDAIVSRLRVGNGLHHDVIGPQKAISLIIKARWRR